MDYRHIIIIIIIIILIIAIILILNNIDNIKHHYNDVKYFTRCDWKKNYLLNNNMIDKPLVKNNKIAIITFENRKDAEYIDLHNKNVSAYCDKWNYKYLFYDHCVHNIYWCKMYLVLDALKSGNYDYVMWMDSDSVIKNNNISLDSIVNKYSSDIFVNLDGGDSVYCAGIFIIKNSPIGIAYIEDCIRHNTKECLTDNNNLKGIWAGLCYEQGIMNQLIFDKYYNNTTCLPQYLVYNVAIDETLKSCNLDTFILHLYGSQNKFRTKCFSRFV
jgi:hypothetical protein